jgi:hypothetical protein
MFSPGGEEELRGSSDYYINIRSQASEIHFSIAPQQPNYKDTEPPHPFSDTIIIV